MNDAPGMPAGWFAVAHHADLGPGGVLPVQRFGRDLVLYRTQAGAWVLLDAVCPHLGAHLGHGGTVDGDAIVCLFHGFRYGPDGACRGSGFGEPAPRGVSVQAWPVVERSGFVFAWHDPQGAAPTWSLPTLRSEGVAPFSARRIRLAAHPQDTTENSVDLGHFAWVHGYRDTRIVEPVARQGPVLRIAYRARRTTGPLRTDLPFTYRVEAHGLGFSRVQVEIPGGIVSELLILATPVTATDAEVWLGARILLDGVRGVPGPVGRAVARAVSPFMARLLEGDVSQDAQIWANKRWVHPPRLVPSGGPIGLYRAWAQQFQADGRTASAEVATPRSAPGLA